MTLDGQKLLAIECGANYEEALEYTQSKSTPISYFVFDGTEVLSAYTAAVEAKERERCANVLNLNNPEIMLMAGELTNQELRTVKSVLNALQFKITDSAL